MTDKWAQHFYAGNAENRYFPDSDVQMAMVRHTISKARAAGVQISENLDEVRWIITTHDQQFGESYTDEDGNTQYSPPQRMIRVEVRVP